MSGTSPGADTSGDCGSSSECDEVLRDVWLFLDDEMDERARSAVAAHLDGCSPCLQEADLYHKLKKLVHRGCSGEVAPDQLRAKVFSTLSQLVVSGPAGTTVQTTAVTGITVQKDQRPN